MKSWLTGFVLKILALAVFPIIGFVLAFWILVEHFNFWRKPKKDDDTESFGDLIAGTISDTIVSLLNTPHPR